MQTSHADPHALAQAGLAALRGGDAARARSLFEQVTTAGRGDASVWIGLAYACRALGDQPAKLAAADEALRRDPRALRALILKGDHFAEAGDARSASAFYRAALQVAATSNRLPADLLAEVRRVQQAEAGLARSFETHLAEALKARGVDVSACPRFAESLDLMTGRKQVYLQEPRFYYFPGLTQAQFHPREALPWLDRVEAATDAIRAELLAVLEQPGAFVPYVEERENRPNNSQRGMLANPDWSAFFLWKDGVELPENTARFPTTMAALEGAPLTDIPGRTPSILFSQLKPGARIPPHNGLVNTRLICHLPLIAPPGCALRVGNETREWVEGRAWAFDDTIEHEAWNGSDRTRVVLIFDVWKPELSEAEREMIRAMFQAIDGFGAGGEAWGV